jgi:abequosyltransferase
VHQDEYQTVNSRLSICIATYNRASYIGETLNSITSQLESDVEIVVVDGASTDTTEVVLQAYASANPSIRYIRENENTGMDSGYDKAVLNARGEYCWLMSDDDLLKPGAVQRVLSLLEMQHELIVVNAEVRSTDFSVLLETRRLPYIEDQYFTASNREQFFTNVMKYL